jgi:hypothetical protein
MSFRAAIGAERIREMVRPSRALYQFAVHQRVENRPGESDILVRLKENSVSNFENEE